MSINSRIKIRREEIGLSRQELAEKIGVTPSAIANYENGISSPKIELLYKVFEALDCDANYLYQDEVKTIQNKVTELSYEEEQHMKKYRQLDDDGRKTVDNITDREYDHIIEHREFLEYRKKMEEATGIKYE